VTNSGTITISGFGASGIIATSAAIVDATALTTVTNTGTIATTGGGAPAVFASSYALDLLANATATTVVNNSGAGSITTTGAGAAGVAAYADAIAFTGTATATVTVNNSAAIQTTGAGSNAITAGIVFGSATSGININNTAAGSIIAGGAPYHAVMATGAKTTITNAGLISGNVLLSAFADTFNNNAGGRWVMQGNSDFGAGADAVNNTGDVSMVKAGSTLTAATVAPIGGRLFYTVTVAGLENFNNTGGQITMVDGQPNDQIVLSGNFNGTGNSRLAVDAFLGPVGSTADILSVNGNVTGTTHVIVNDTNPGLGAFNPVGIPVVIVGGTTTATNFDLPGGAIDKGFFSYDLFLRPDKVWVLASAPNQRANELPRLVSAAEEIWHQASALWLDRTADLRSQFMGPMANASASCDPRIPRKVPCVASNAYGGGPGLWLRGFGDWSRSNATANSTLFGRTTTFDVGFDQSIYGVQGGVDWATNRLGYSSFMVGVLAGYVGSNVDFTSGSRATFSGGNIGAYATFLNGGLFADSLIMANFGDMRFKSAPLLNTKSNVATFGGHFDFGYRFPMQGGWFAEPLASLEYVKAVFQDMAIPGTTVALGGDSVRGRLGARFGTTFVSGSVRMEPSLTLSVWNNFRGDNTTTLTSGGFVVDLPDAGVTKTYGEVGLALNMFELGTHWSGFLKGDARFGNSYRGGSAKGGFRYQW
jgi:outer membrane autotransporter protein